jgi:sec-independent protein translocase protein TatB
VFNLGFGEIAVVVVVALLFLGPKMLPEIAGGLGKIIREFRKATSDIRHEIEIDDLIRKPLQELREAATLPPEELKRRDAAKAALRKVEEEEARRKQQEAEAAKAAQEAAQKAQAADAALAKAQAEAVLASAEGAATPQVPTDVVSAGGTMIASPPPSDDPKTLTPLPEMHSPAPAVTAPPPPRLPPPLPPPPRPVGRTTKSVPTVPEATVVDLSAQLKAASEMQSTTVAGRPAPIPAKPRTTTSRPVEDKKS